ncbi:hypothetical protein H9P43_003420 [Blastocladiella emersonii ATCC 22665]|nr:hypothetical protein H9P43_003420 [Blastocladiella emersonii ATCC 22665]
MPRLAALRTSAPRLFKPASRSLTTHADPALAELWSTTVPRVRYLRPALFAVGGSLAAFGLGVAVYDRNQVLRQGGTSSFEDMWRRQRAQAAAAKRAAVHRIAEWSAVPFEVKKACTMVVNRWYNLYDGQKVAAGLIAVNAAVFLAWQIPRVGVQRFMYKWFTHHPLSGRSVTLLLSTYSHQTALHFGMNMLGVWTVGSLLHQGLGSTEEFLAFYTAGGLMASLASHTVALRTIAHAMLLPSLGASGALLACLGAVAVMHPDLGVSLIFLPGVDLPLKYAFPGLVGLDLAGVVRGWQTFDHVAHLGGSVFGLAYVAGLREVLWYGAMENYIRVKHGLAVRSGRP